MGRVKYQRAEGQRILPQLGWVQKNLKIFPFLTQRASLPGTQTHLMFCYSLIIDYQQNMEVFL
jgi:hypothetical protein